MKGRKRSSGGEAQFKLIMIGDSGAGKSCLLSRYIKDYFTPQYHVTLGAEFESKTIQVDQNYKTKLQIWDTAGQQTFRSIVKSFYRNSAAVVLIYNISNLKSFEHLQSWLEQARQNAPSHALYILIGTHLDLQDKREVSKEQVEQFTKANNISLSFQTSAKDNINITTAFEEIAKQIFHRVNSINGQKMVLEQDRSHKKCCS